MLDKLYLFLPLTSATLYGIASLGLRSASQEGVSPWRTTFVTNGLSALAFLIYLREWPTPDLPGAWLPVIGMGFIFFLGNTLTMLAFQYGDVSIATPVLTAKVMIVVAILTVLHDSHISMATWIAGALTVTGMILLQMQGKDHPRHHHVTLTILLSLGAATCFAIFDLATQFQSEAHGFHRVGPYAIQFAALFSFILLPFCKDNFKQISTKGKRSMWIGGGLITVQASILIFSLGTFNDAANINIVYGSRGLWGIFMVWALGRFFGNEELKKNKGVIKFRIAGAACIVSAIGLVFA